MRFLRYGICVFLVTFSFCCCCFCAYGENLIDYYPLKEGNLWVYEIEDGAIIEENVTTGEGKCLPQTQAVKIVCSDGRYMCVSVDSEGVKLHKDFDGYSTNIYPEPLMLVPFGIEDKGIYKREQKYSTQNDDGAFECLTKHEIKFIGREDVVVPAGKFAGCVKILETSSWSESDTRGEDQTFYWLARGIGMVKKISESSEVDNMGRRLDGYPKHKEFKLRKAIVDGKNIRVVDEE